ncbi:hypothetical protein [Marmoricola sp. RAF53]|uniref:hypothetical protein n=1 Tax=Marmoricola sp. RAF53 TaxID=3233059 RepID=UPI003F9E8CAB
MRITRVLAATAAAAALVVAPAAAWAGSDTHTDPSADVVSVKVQPTTVTSEPTQARGDIASIRVSHLKSTVRVKVRFRDLSPSGDGAGHYFALRSNNTLRYIDVEAGPGKWRGERTVYNAKDKKTTCRGASHKIDYTANTVLLVVPRACLGNPKWVRVAQYSIVAENDKVFADDARVTGYKDGFFYGPRVRR